MLFRSFDFRHNVDRQRVGSVAIVAKLGFVSYSDVYVLFGAKYGYNFYGYSLTSTSVTSRARYDHIIGEDDGGLLSDMPNITLISNITKIFFIDNYVFSC